MKTRSSERLATRATPPVEIPIKEKKQQAQAQAPGNEDENLLSSTAKGASYLILLQFISRMLTFSLNQIVLRYTTKETFGIASVNLELLSSTILFISREGFRSTLVRSSSDNKAQQQQQILNLAYIPTCLGLVTTLLTCGYYLKSITPNDLISVPYYRVAVILYGSASLIELLVEPLFILALNNLYFQLRVTVEGVAVVLRCVITFALTFYFAGNEELGILSFAIAQLVFGVTMMVGYLAFFLYKERSLKKLLPHQVIERDQGVEKKYWLYKPLLNLGVTMTKQSLLKHVLTEGDKMLISVLSSAEDRGVYAFVVNYGSLIARILFQPMEETGRTFFSKLLVLDEKVEKEQQEKVTRARQTAANVLMILIQFHVLLGLVFICFATNYSSTLIHLLAGKKWATGQGNAPGVLAMYCIYVPFMGINGITEGFVQAVATKQDLTRLSYYMILFSACFITSGFVFMYCFEMGAIGLILANMVNLGIRVTYSWYFIKDYFKQSVILTVRQWFPHQITVTAFVLSWSITFWSKNHIGWLTFQQKLLHIAVGGICFILVAGIIVWKEKNLIGNVKRLRNHKFE